MYCAVFGAGISYMLKLVAKGPEETGDVDHAPLDADPSLRPARARPILAAPGNIEASMSGLSARLEG
jgi:cytochrome bd ubiquinol oxidase subunit I